MDNPREQIPTPQTPEEVAELLDENYNYIGAAGYSPSPEIQDLLDNYYEHGDEVCGACHAKVHPTREGSECGGCGRTVTYDARPTIDYR